MSAESSHPEEDNYQMMSDNSNQNCPMSHLKVSQELNIAVGAHANNMNMGNGQFGNFFQLNHGHTRPLSGSHSTESTLIPRNIAASSDRSPLSVPVNYTFPFDASTLMCPIMMLKKPTSHQKYLNQNNPVSELSPTQRVNVPLNKSILPNSDSQSYTESDAVYNLDFKDHTQGQPSLQDKTCQHYPVPRSDRENHFYELQRKRHDSCQRNNLGQFPESASQHSHQQTYQHGHHPHVSSSEDSFYPPHTFQNRQYSTESGASQFIHNHDHFLGNRDTIHYHQTHTQCHEQLPGNGRFVFHAETVPHYVHDFIKEGDFQDGSTDYTNHQRNCPGFTRTASSGITSCGSANFNHNHSLCGRGYNPPQQQLVAGGCHEGVNIRWQEKETIKRLLKPGQVIQVCGAPMVGKSTVVRQAINEVVSYGHQLIQHHITCRDVSTFQEFLSLVVQKFCPQLSHVSHHDADTVVSGIRSVLQQHNLHHHILVFHKCENLKNNPHGRQFLDFLARIRNELATVPVTIVFTTYKFYWFPPSQSVHNVEIGVLSIKDIIALLHYYVPHVDVVTYAHVLAKTFCFPEAIQLIVEEFLADETCRVKPEKLEKKINGDSQFLSQLFESRLQEVETWVPMKCLSFLTHFGHSIENSFTEAHLEYTNSSDVDQEDSKKVISYLKQNYVVRLLQGDINRLVIHPLVVFYSMTSLNRDNQQLPQKWFDRTCNRYTHFLGRVLLSAEASLQEHGRKGLVYGGLFQEWSNVRYVIQMALHCNMDTYENFLKVAVSASGFILKIFPKEAQSFYWGLYQSARDYGTPCDLAVMEAMLGQAVAEGTGKDWTRADGYFSSAIQRLSGFGNSYFLGWTLLKKAMLLHRQGKYEESSGFFRESRRVLRSVDYLALGEKFYVSETKVEEEIITEEIQETMPIIFTGKPKLARRRLDRILQIIESSFENHPELATLLNLVGLTEQRGNKNLENAIRWYKLSYNERMYLAKVCPESLLAVLNNIGMIYFYQGNTDECMKYLMKALDIRQECGWTHYNTGLTLIHVAEINLKIGNYVDSYKQALEAARIFDATVKDHDMRLRVNFNLAHIRSMLRQALQQERSSPREATNQDYCQLNREWRNRNSERGLPGEQNGHGQSIPRHEGETSKSTGVTGDKAGTNIKKNVRGKPLFSYSSKNHKFPASQDIIHVTETEIEPCDLQMSAEAYLEKLLKIASSMTGTFSDDGMSLVLCSHEHIMLLNLENSPEKYEEHKNALAEFSQGNPWLEESGAIDGAGVDSKYRCLIKHKNLYSYIMNTPYSQLDMATFIELMKDACLTCRFVKRVLTSEMWANEARHYIQERKKKKRLLQEFDRMRTDSVSSAPEVTREDCRMFSGIQDLGHETVNLLQESTSALSRNASDVGIRVPLATIPRLPNFDELISNSNSQIQYLPHQFQSNVSSQIQYLPQQFQDSDEYLEDPCPDVYQEQAVACSENPQCHTLFHTSRNVKVPRIDNDQRNILDKIQSCRPNHSSAHSVSVGTKGHSPGAILKNRTNSNGTDTRTSAYLHVLREPVEQSYDGSQDSSWDSDASLHAKNAEDLQDKFQKNVFDQFHQHNCQSPDRNFIFDADSREQDLVRTQRKIDFHGSQPTQETSVLGRQTITENGGRQTITENDYIWIKTNFVRDMVTPNNRSKVHLVKTESRSADLSRTDNPVSPLPVSEENNPNDSLQIKTSSPGQEKFSTVGYLERNGFNLNISKSVESKTHIGKSHENNSWHNVQNLIQGSEQPNSVDHQVLSSSVLEVNGSSTVTDIERKLVVDTNMKMPSSTQKLLNTGKSHLENDSQFYAQYQFHDPHECLSERVPKLPRAPPCLQHVVGKDSSDDPQNVPDSDLELLSKMGSSDSESRRGSGSGSSSVSRRSRTVSASSLHSGGHAGQDRESGYLSQQNITGARPKTSSDTGRSHQNLTTVSNKCSRHPKNSSQAAGPQTKGFSEMQFSRRENFKASSGSTHDIRGEKNVPSAVGYYHADINWSCPEQIQDIHGPDIDAQSVGFSNSLRTVTQIFRGNQNGSSSSSSREPVEQSWTATLTLNEHQSRARDVMLIAGDVFRPEVLHLQAQSLQNQSEQTSN